MKKIINGKKYDTETATRIEHYDNGLGGSDFNMLSETLYRKKNGEFFLYGEGGAKTEYAVQRGNWWRGSEQLVPLTVDDAKDWAEQHCDCDKYEELFGEVEE